MFDPITLSAQHFHELVREAYKQGYLNARYDAENTEPWNDDDESLNDWLAEAMADAKIGDIDIEIE